MENTLTEIAVVLDRSGSMESARTDTIGGFNAFLAEQVDDAGDVNVTLAQFDNEYDVVYLREPIRRAPRLTADTYVPRGSTALLDAIGRTIDELGARLAAMPAAERPGKVIFVVITDGLENASRDYTREQVFQRIRHQSDVYGWEFVYLGAKQDAIAAGAQVGIDAGFALSCADGEVATRALYQSLASNVKMRRAGSKSDMRWEVRDRQ
ncbi:MAG: VWA domain-containing protein, partial [Burkholderiales bacterium]|nr:VWA domain-containing protein [Burkholderiales bacterium]